MNSCGRIKFAASYGGVNISVNRLARVLLRANVVNYFAKATLGIVVGLLSAVQGVHAIATLRISADLGATWVQTRDIDGDGNVSFSGSVGSVGNMWTVSVAAGETKPAVGSDQDPVMNLSSLDVSSVAAGTLLIEFSDKSFSGPLIGNSFMTSLQSHNSGGGSTSVRTYWDGANVLFSRPSVNRLGNITETGTGDSSVTSTGPLPGATLYSLTMRVTISHDANGSSSFSSQLVDPVPEAGTTLVLLGLAVLALGAIRCWSFKTHSA